MADTKDFKWTDELVSDFILQECNKYDTWSKEGIELFLERFKDENCPSTPKPLKVISLKPEPLKDKADSYKHYEMVVSGVIEVDNVVKKIEGALNFKPNLDANEIWTTKDKLDAMMENVWNAAREKASPYLGSDFLRKDFSSYKASLTENKKLPLDLNIPDNIQEYGEKYGKVQTGFFEQKEQPIYAEKPPLGLLPEIFWLEGRLKDVEAAIERYTKALKEIPSSWIEERYQLRNKIHNIQNNQK